MLNKIIKREANDIAYVDDVNLPLMESLGYEPMTDEEIDKHENPLKYLTEDELVQLRREKMPNLDRIAFKWKLVKAGIYEQVNQMMTETDDLLLKIAYQDATYFSRTDPLLTKATQALSLTAEQVDHIWLNV